MYEFKQILFSKWSINKIEWVDLFYDNSQYCPKCLYKHSIIGDTVSRQHLSKAKFNPIKKGERLEIPPFFQAKISAYKMFVEVRRR